MEIFGRGQVEERDFNAFHQRFRSRSFRRKPLTLRRAAAGAPRWSAAATHRLLALLWGLSQAATASFQAADLAATRASAVVRPLVLNAGCNTAVHRISLTSRAP